jgi:hypothetical protein
MVSLASGAVLSQYMLPQDDDPENIWLDSGSARAAVAVTHFSASTTSPQPLGDEMPILDTHSLRLVARWSCAKVCGQGRLDPVRHALVLNEPDLHRLEARTLATGPVIWRTPSEQGCLAVTVGRVVVAGAAELEVYDLRTGKLLHQDRLGQQPSAVFADSSSPALILETAWEHQGKPGGEAYTTFDALSGHVGVPLAVTGYDTGGAALDPSVARFAVAVDNLQTGAETVPDKVVILDLKQFVVGGNV